MDETKSELTPRQWRLYNILKAQASVGKWTSQFDLYCYMSAWEDTRYPVVLDDSKFHNSRTRIMMTEDIRAINNSAVIQKIILSSSKGVKIANEEEWKKYKESKKKSLLAQLKRYSILLQKARNDGQMRITFGSERDVIEAFINATEEDSEKTIL